MNTAARTYGIILTDDHPILREGLKRLISDESSFEVVDEASNGRELLDKLDGEHLSCDLVIMDLTMPVMDGLEATRRIRMIYPGTKVLILTMHDNRSNLQAALQAGVDGYLLKDDVFDSLIGAIHSIREGRRAFSRKLLPIVNEWEQNQSTSNPAAEIPAGNEDLPFQNLTRREKEVLSFVATGLTSKQIGSELGISSRTVESHRARVMEKLGIRNVAGLVKFAVQSGILEEH